MALRSAVYSVFEADWQRRLVTRGNLRSELLGLLTKGLACSMDELLSRSPQTREESNYGAVTLECPTKGNYTLESQ